MRQVKWQRLIAFYLQDGGENKMERAVSHLLIFWNDIQDNQICITPPPAEQQFRVQNHTHSQNDKYASTSVRTKVTKKY